MFFFNILLVLQPLLGQDVRISNLEFKNNQGISSGKLKSAILTKTNAWYHVLLPWKKSPLFDEDTFLGDLLRIEKFYHQEGYLQAKVVDYKLLYNDKRDKVKAVVEIDEGAATEVEQVAFESHSDSELPIAAEKLQTMVNLRTGKRYKEEELKLDYHKLIEEFSNRGYPFIQARVKPVIDRESHAVALKWSLDSGPFCSFGPIEITGNASVSTQVIRRGLGFRTGEPFVQKKLATAQSQVYRLELFQFVSLRALNLDQPTDTVPVEVRVRESTLRTLKFGVGYGTEELLRGTVNWQHRNFLGGGRILRGLAKHSRELLPLQLELELSQPYFLSNRNDLIVKPFFVWQDERSFEARRIGFETTLNRQLTRRVNAFLSTKVERDTVEIKARGSEVAEELADLYNKSIIRTGISRNSTDQLFTPTRGSVARFVLEEAGRFLQTRFRYVKALAEYRKFNQVKPGYVLAWRVFLGSMRPIRGSKATPVEERFFAGGSYSVRGWRRQLLGPLELSTATDSTTQVVPVGGNSVIEGSVELRNPIYKQLSGALFLDYGNVWDSWKGFDLFDLHYAIGAGIRYNSLIGPLRLDLAWKLNKQELDSGNFQFHISIGQAF